MKRLNFLVCRGSVRKRSVELVCLAYKQVYASLIIEENEYPDVRSLAPRQPHQVAELLSWSVIEMSYNSVAMAVKCLNLMLQNDVYVIWRHLICIWVINIIVEVNCWWNRLVWFARKTYYGLLTVILWQIMWFISDWC